MSIITWNDGWTILRNGLDEIWERCEERGDQWRLKARDYDYLYSTAYNICTQRTPHNFSENLYNTLMKYSTDLVSFTIASKISASDDPVKIVQIIQREHVKYQKYIKTNQRIFNYLDRYHCKYQQLLLLIDAQINIFYKKLIVPYFDIIFQYLRIQVSGLIYSPSNRCFNLRNIRKLFNDLHQLDVWLEEVGVLLKAELLTQKKQLIGNGKTLWVIFTFIDESFPSSHMIFFWLKEEGFMS
eukprot:gene4115-4405_t